MTEDQINSLLDKSAASFASSIDWTLIADPQERAARAMRTEAELSRAIERLSQAGRDKMADTLDALSEQIRRRAI
jgi:hypothetical protein